MHGHRRPSSAGVRRLLIPAIVLVIAAWSLPAEASSWPIGSGAVSTAQAQARPAPAAPATPTAACNGVLLSPKITVTWTAVANASTYTVYESTTAATGPYVSVATGVTTTSWTSPSMGTGGFWFKVTATVGIFWVSAQSVATNGISVILGVLCA